MTAQQQQQPMTKGEYEQRLEVACQIYERRIALCEAQVRGYGDAMRQNAEMVCELREWRKLRGVEG